MLPGHRTNDKNKRRAETLSRDGETGPRKQQKSKTSKEADRNVSWAQKRWDGMCQHLVEFKNESQWGLGACVSQKLLGAIDFPWKSKTQNSSHDSSVDGKTSSTKSLTSSTSDSEGKKTQVSGKRGAKRGTYNKWDGMFEQLVEYKGKHGHVQVQSRPAKGDLGSWVRSQRYRARSGNLPAHRATKLQDIGVTWTRESAGSLAGSQADLNANRTHQKRWDDNFELLVEFKKKYGHVRVLRSHNTKSGLAAWAGGQRRAGRDGTLDAGRAAKLQEIGLTWENPRSVGKKDLNAIRTHEKGRCDDVPDRIQSTPAITSTPSTVDGGFDSDDSSHLRPSGKTKRAYLW